MNKTILMLLALLFGTAATVAQPLTQTVVAQGKIEGVEADGLAYFKGVPYAEPPVGKMRWKAPVPAKPWEGTFKADTYRANPVQKVKSQPEEGMPGIGEDCLYLNIITPAHSADDRLPVIVWIHGGSFSGGSAIGLPGDNFARQGLVYVCIEYRTGALGFLAHPELSAESERGLSGNYGLMDQLLGLHWVQDNIAAFGGDPKKVTILGESAGAISVSMLCASPLAKGLFRGAISQSGGAFCPVDTVKVSNTSIRNLQMAEEFGEAFMQRMGAKNIAELREMPYEKWLDDSIGNGMNGFWPCVDGYVITDDQYKLYESGDYNDVNILIGTNSDEGSMFVQPCPVAEYEATVTNLFGPYAGKVLHEYPATNEVEAYYAQADIFREAAFAWPTYAWANLQRQTGKHPVYLYYFDVSQKVWFGPKELKARGAGHAFDLPYVFNHPFLQQLTDDDRHVSELMVRYWTNFIKTGDPNGEGLQQWPVYEKDTKTVMHFTDQGTALITVPNRGKIELMEEFFRWKRK